MDDKEFEDLKKQVSQLKECCEKLRLELNALRYKIDKKQKSRLDNPSSRVR
jgi:regulator of replication initiation timing